MPRSEMPYNCKPFPPQGTMMNNVDPWKAMLIWENQVIKRELDSMTKFNKKQRERQGVPEPESYCPSEASDDEEPRSRSMPAKVRPPRKGVPPIAAGVTCTLSQYTKPRKPGEPSLVEEAVHHPRDAVPPLPDTWCPRHPAPPQPVTDGTWQSKRGLWWLDGGKAFPNSQSQTALEMKREMDEAFGGAEAEQRRMRRAKDIRSKKLGFDTRNPRGGFYTSKSAGGAFS